jgi:hypothetical protein
MRFTPRWRFLRHGTSRFACAKEISFMVDPVTTVYLFQCQGEDLFAVSHDMTGANIPRSPCTHGWEFCEQFELGLRARVPAPIMAEPIMKGIADNGYYVWRGWSGPSPRPTRERD